MGGIEGYKIILTFHSDSTSTTTYLKKYGFKKNGI